MIPENSVPRSVGEIASYHAHVYYDPATTRPEAERLRAWIDERFAVTLGRWHDVKVGPTIKPCFRWRLPRTCFPHWCRG
jgi:aromatic ring-cleaving dioxygenase